MEQSGKEFFKERYESLGGSIEYSKVNTAIRFNTLKSISGLEERLKNRGISLKKIAWLEYGFEVIRSKTSIGAIPEHLLGYFFVQSSVSQLPAQVLSPKKGDVVFDMCASPGAKCTQLAALMENKGSLLACEINKDRVLSLSTNLERCNVQNCVAFNSDASKARKFNISFDKVLLDAPCSGNFVNDDSWFTRRSLQGIKRSSQIQRRLLRIASEVLKPRGTLVYSTCSLDPLENELNAQWAIDNLPLSLVETNINVGDPGIVLDGCSDEISKCRRFWPHKHKTEGFFIAKFVKGDVNE